MATPEAAAAKLPTSSDQAAPTLSLDPLVVPNTEAAPTQQDGQASRDYFLQTFGQTSPTDLGKGHPPNGAPQEQPSSGVNGNGVVHGHDKDNSNGNGNGNSNSNSNSKSNSISREGAKDFPSSPRPRHGSTSSRAGSISRKYGRTVSTISTQRTRLEKGTIDMSQAIIVAPPDDPRPKAEFHVRSGDNTVFAVHKANITTNSCVFRDVLHQHDAAAESRVGVGGEPRAKEEGMRLEERASIVEPLLQCLYPIPVANIKEEDLFDFLAASSKYGIQRGIELSLAWIAIGLHARISQGGSTSLGYWKNLEKKNLLQFWLAHSEHVVSQPISQLVQGAFEEALIPWCHHFDIPTGPIALSDMLSEAQYRRLNFEDYAKLERTVRELEKRRESLAVGTTS